MIVNIYDLASLGIEKNEARAICKKAEKLPKVRIFTKMCTCDDDAIRNITHFDIEQFIVASELDIKTIRITYVAVNKRRLRAVKKVLIKLKEKEAKNV